MGRVPPKQQETLLTISSMHSLMQRLSLRAAQLQKLPLPHIDQRNSAML